MSSVLSANAVNDAVERTVVPNSPTTTLNLLSLRPWALLAWFALLVNVTAIAIFYLIYLFLFACTSSKIRSCNIRLASIN
jgi:hypothetical protein